MVRLWFVKESDKARLYSKLPRSRNPEAKDQVWVPRSVCEHTTKRPAVEGEWPEHEVEVADWFADKEKL